MQQRRSEPRQIEFLVSLLSKIQQDHGWKKTCRLGFKTSYSKLSITTSRNSCETSTGGRLLLSGSSKHLSLSITRNTWKSKLCQTALWTLLEHRGLSGRSLREFQSQSNRSLRLVRFRRLLGMSGTDWRSPEVAQLRIAPSLVAFFLSFVHVAPCSHWKCA